MQVRRLLRVLVNLRIALHVRPAGGMLVRTLLVVDDGVVCFVHRLRHWSFFPWLVVGTVRQGPGFQALGNTLKAQATSPAYLSWGSTSERGCNVRGSCRGVVQCAPEGLRDRARAPGCDHSRPFCLPGQLPG